VVAILAVAHRAGYLPEAGVDVDVETDRDPV
jgi:hypothetical protein